MAAKMTIMSRTLRPTPVLAMGFLILGACRTMPTTAPAASPSRAASDEAVKRFAVYTDREPRNNHYVPSGYMGDSDLTISGAYTSTPDGQGPCLRVTYHPPGPQRWAGVYWQDPANNWGEAPGNAGYDLRGATRLVFWARGENGGEKIKEFRMGGIVGKYPDSDVATLGRMSLSKDWKRYAIDLRHKDLRRIIGGFGFFVTQYDNPGGAVFYLDDIVYETPRNAPAISTPEEEGTQGRAVPSGVAVTSATERGLPAEKVLIPPAPVSPLSKEIRVKTEEEGLRVSFSSQFLFRSGRSDLLPESRQILDQVVDVLKAYPKNRVLVEGHTDSLGDASYNLELSRLRAQQVQDYLIQKGGFDRGRFETVGYGATRPVAGNETAVDRARNRRVELIILKAVEKP